MGREAVTLAAVGDLRGEVRALLESQDLILRGALRRTFARADIRDPVVDNGALSFVCGNETVRLELGEAMAEAWRQILLRPAPSLREKLGLGPGRRALVTGDCDDPALVEALSGMTTAQRDEAAMVIARIAGAADLDRALGLAEQAGRPLWTIYAKGKGASFGDGAVRERMRAAGWRDTKSCAVSAALTATRYHPPA